MSSWGPRFLRTEGSVTCQQHPRCRQSVQVPHFVQDDKTQDDNALRSCLSLPGKRQQRLLDALPSLAARVNQVEVIGLGNLKQVHVLP